MQIDRAKQFMPFAALKGFNEALREKEKIKVDKIYLCEDAINIIDNALKSLKIGDMVEVIYFKNDEYIKQIGLVSKIKNDHFYIVREKIYYKNLYKIEVIQ